MSTQTTQTARGAARGIPDSDIFDLDILVSESGKEIQAIVVTSIRSTKNGRSGKILGTSMELAVQVGVSKRIFKNPNWTRSSGATKYFRKIYWKVA